MALGRENVSVARTNGGADVFCLAGFLRDDDLICHDGPFGRMDFGNVSIRTYREHCRQVFLLPKHTECPIVTESEHGESDGLA